MKFTRQGVRDLNSLAGKPNTKKLSDLPKEGQCPHPANAKRLLPSGDTKCEACGQMWDWYADPY